MYKVVSRSHQTSRHRRLSRPRTGASGVIKLLEEQKQVVCGPLDRVTQRRVVGRRACDAAPSCDYVLTVERMSALNRDEISLAT